MTTTSGLYTSMNNAITGLNANKQALAVLSQNISNANTPGYSRQKVNLATNIIDGQGYGVSVESVTRQVDLYLQRATQVQNAVVSNASTLNDYNARIQTLLGQPNGSSTVTADTSVASAITGFFTTLQQLASSPTDSSLQVSAVQTGQGLATRISSLASGLEDLRYQADQQINQDVNSINDILKNLQDTNAALAKIGGNGASSSDLLDQRDKQLSALSQYVDITYYFDDQQQVHISTNGGTTLLDTARYQLSYSPQSSTQSIVAGVPNSPIQVYRLDDSGKQLQPPQTLVTGGVGSAVTTSMTTGEIPALLSMRDQQIPQMIDQLDQMTSMIVDQVNAVHNMGNSFPGANSYTGERQVSAADNTGWTGSIQVALLDKNGQPLASPYTGDTNGLPPLNLDLSNLDTGSGKGYPTVQGIINAINSYYAPQNKASIGDLHNLQLASDSSSIPGSATNPSFTFDFNAENLSANSSQLFVGGITVTDDQGNVAGTVTTTQPSLALSGTNTYTTTAGSSLVTVNLGAPLPSTVKAGDYIYLSQPPSGVDNIPANQLGGYFQIKNISGNTFQIDTQTTALNSTSANDAGMTGTLRYASVDAGDNTRTKDGGMFTANFTNTNTSFYTISAEVATQNADGTLSMGTVQYKVLVPNVNQYNALYGAASGTGAVTVQQPASYTPLATAQLVDANGKPLAKINGAYPQNTSGYLQIVATDPNNSVAINSADSKEVGYPNQVPPVAGTNRGFSYYFGLNNFYKENNPTPTGDTVKGSALAIAMESRLTSNPSLVSLGQITQSTPVNGVPRWTYERAPGDNSVISQLANLGSKGLLFTAAGGLGTTTTTLNGYAGQIISFASSQANTAQSNYNNANTILQGLNQQVSSNSGVNLDEELANTIIYQNAYSASARIITVTNSLFSTLINTFQG